MPQPTIKLQDVPEQERIYAEIINDALSNLTTFTINFDAALNLHNFSHQQLSFATNKNARADVMLFMQWLLIAARDGAMSIYHFSESIKTIQANLGSCPSVRGAVNSQRLREANKLFRSWFPDFRDIRDSVAHAGELTKNPKRKESRKSRAGHKNKFFSIPKGVHSTIIGSLLGLKFTYTLKNKTISYEISAETLDRLENIKSKVFNAFPDP